MYTYFEPLLPQSRLVPPFWKTTMLPEYPCIISVSSCCTDFKKLHFHSLSKNYLMKSFAAKGEGVLGTDTKFDFFWIGFKRLNSVHERCFGPAWLGVLLWLFASSPLSEPAARTPSPPYPAGVPVTPATQAHFWPISNPVKPCRTHPQSGAGPYHGLLLKGQSPFPLPNSLINQNREENIYLSLAHLQLLVLPYVTETGIQVN